MRSAHGAGFLYALGSMLKFQSPDMVIGSSGNAASVLCYATKRQDQFDRLKSIWTERLSTPKFISYTRLSRLMDVDYLIDTVFKKERLLPEGSLEQSSIDYYVSIVDAETGIARFMTKRDKVDPFELLRASKALPVLYRKTVRILGRDYIDGVVGQTLQSQIDFAVSKGATRILFINDSSPRTFLLKYITFFYALGTPKGLRRKIFHDLFTKQSHLVPDGIEFLYVYRERMPASIITRDRKKLTDTFELGIQDALHLEKELRELLR